MKKGVFYLSLLLAVACTNTAKFGMVGTRNVDYSATYSKSETTEAQGEVEFILLIPKTVEIMHPIEQIDQALAKGGYEFMTNAEITQSLLFTIIYNHAVLKVKGTGWKKNGVMGSIELNKNVLLLSETSKEFVQAPQDLIDLVK